MVDNRKNCSKDHEEAVVKPVFVVWKDKNCKQDVSGKEEEDGYPECNEPDDFVLLNFDDGIEEGD